VHFPILCRKQQLEAVIGWAVLGFWLQVYLLAQFLESWEKDEDAKLVIFKVRALLPS
jgi:hypothetical protein